MSRRPANNFSLLFCAWTDLVPESPPERPEEIEASAAARAARTAL